MLEVSKSTKRTIYRNVHRDLKPARSLVHGKMAVALLVGGIASLALYGQFGYGLTQEARTAYARIAASTSTMGCMLISGALFAALPVATLRAMCNALQFRAIAHRTFLPMLAWLGLFELVVAYRADFDAPGQELVVWFAGATIAFHMLAPLVDKMSFSSKKAALGDAGL